VTQIDPGLLEEAVAMCQSMNYPGDDEEDRMGIVAQVARLFDVPWGVLESAWNDQLLRTAETLKAPNGAD
jgi:hypothetical protein